MPFYPSLTRLHLRYRLWIAELNADINIIRILSDYLSEQKTKNDEAPATAEIKHFEQLFLDMRKEIDALRDQMHLLKMKLAAYGRNNKPFDYSAYQSDKHNALKKEYTLFRKKFTTVKSALASDKSSISQ